MLNETSSSLLSVLSKDLPNVSADQNYTIIDSANLTLTLCDPITDLISALKCSILGISVLKYYQSTRKLDDVYRSHLADAILFIEMRTSPELL